MANVIINDTHLNNIADSIRNKNGTSTKYKPSEMATAISKITTSEDLSSELTEQNTLLSNQVVTIDDIKLALQNKSIGGGGEIVLQEKTITPTTSQQSVIADSDYNGLSKVIVNAVTSSIDSDIKAINIRKGIDILGVTGTMEEYVEPNLQEKTVSPSTSSQSVVADSSYDGLSKVTVNAIKLQTKTATPTTSSQNIAPDSSYNGLSKVTVGAVTSSIDSNIKSTNIKSGVTILGVTGTVNEGITPSGTINITTNGTHNVTNYASASVNIPNEDLTNEFNAYESGLSLQETFIENIAFALQNKTSGSGTTETWTFTMENGSTITKEVVIK